MIKLRTNHWVCNIFLSLKDDVRINMWIGYGFVKYEDQRSTILAVDNFNGITLLKRTLRVIMLELH